MTQGVTQMSRKSKPGKKKWKFFWKNVNGLGRLLRVGLGLAFIAGAAVTAEEDAKTARLLGAAGAYLVFVGMLRWCSLRALLKKPTKRAYLRHYPEAAE